MEARLSGFRSLMSCLCSRLCDADAIRACSRSGSVAKILPMSERELTIFSETFDERFQVAPFSG